MATNVKGDLQTQTYRFNWTIQCFFDGCEKVGDFHTSPVFPILHSGEITKWYLHIYPEGDSEKSKDYTSLYLRRKNESGEEAEITVIFQASIVTVSEHNIASQIFTVPHTFKCSESWGWCNFAKRDFIMDPKNGILIDGALTLSCRIKFHPSTQDPTKKLEAYSNLVDKIEKGLGDYEELLTTNQFSDVMFVVQDKRICLHKDILMCRNSFFKAMFDTVPGKKRKLAKNADEIIIKDVDYEVMVEVFRFIYAGKVNNIEKLVKKLLIAADKYAVDDLKALCELTLARNLSADLTVDNVVEYLQLVDKCDTAHLKTPVINFAALHFNEVIDKPGFKDLSNNVMYGILQKIKSAI